MADTKISALTELTGANVAADDVLPIVDTSATQTKKIQFSELESTFSSYAGLVVGLETSNDTVDADHDIDITTGRARDDADSDTMILATAITKQIDAAWAVGTNAGGLDTGTVAADTWYYMWLIKRSDTSVVDVLFSTSSSAPTMPTNYDLKKLISVVRTDASANIVKYYQDENWFKWQAQRNVLNAGTATTETAVTISSAVPSIAKSFTASARTTCAATLENEQSNICRVFVATGVTYADLAETGERDETNATFVPRTRGGMSEIPNTGVFNYQNVQSATTSRNSSIWVHGFKLNRSTV
jgi:hypothetical protein